jgi:hypothetical protein
MDRCKPIEAICAFLLLMQLTCVSCTHEKQKADTQPPQSTVTPMNDSASVDRKSTVMVAEIDRYDRKMFASVTKELREYGIEGYIEGSLSYAVSVARPDAARARQILRESKRVNHQRLRIVEETKTG